MTGLRCVLFPSVIRTGKVSGQGPFLSQDPRVRMAQRKATGPHLDVQPPTWMCSPSPGHAISLCSCKTLRLSGELGCSPTKPILMDAVATWACHGEGGRWPFLVSCPNPIAKGTGNLGPGGERIQMVDVLGRKILFPCKQDPSK